MIKTFSLIEGYSKLPALIPEMRKFEWGPVANGLLDEPMARGFEYAFLTTFEHAQGRDAYLHHPEHAAFAGLLFPHIADIVVFDFVQAL